MIPNIGISAANLKSVTQILSVVLANEVTIYTKTRKFHWNICGDSFMELHKLFENQYKEIEESIDEVAERISKLGSKAIGTMEEFMGNTTIKEHAGVYPISKEMIKELLEDHESVIISLRKNIDDCSEKYKDVGSSDFLTALMEKHETIAWTLRRYFN
ncbi:MAG: DNA starvation/stationary phase protection protein [Flavobacterium sp.]|nr:DNA starvation/stationary phase protection protein [Flavobacterium sp.]